MDLDVSFLHNQLEDIEEDDLDDGTFTAGTAMAVIVLGVIELHRLRTERRKPSRLDPSSKTQLSSDLVDVTEYALIAYPFSDTDGVGWDVSRLGGQSLRDLAELIAAVDQYIESQGDFVLQLRMAMIAKMIEDQSFAARSPGDTSPAHSNVDSTPPTANETATSSSSTLALSVPYPLPPLLHPADSVEAEPCPELLACLPDLVPSSTPNTDPVINRGPSPSFDIPGLTTGLPLSAIDADHWSFLCSKDDADVTSFRNADYAIEFTARRRRITLDSEP
ncbi:hypothetical protein B0H14DRAFT_3530316 [Mycena olivaceomarginata]|nr:hypothetical protein B0H14DRAFT_3530316 [Mycena olivaceomarginata]